MSRDAINLAPQYAAQAIVTGASGYLGSTVASLAPADIGVVRLGREEIIGSTNLLRCTRVLACHGALRHCGKEALEQGNVVYTARVLAVTEPNSTFVYASSRFVRSRHDPYGASKRRAEALVAGRPGGISLRFGSLVGPSPTGAGRSFLTRIVRRALVERHIAIPHEPRRVQPIDVRVASALMWRIVPQEVGAPSLEAVGEPVSTDELADLVVERIHLLTGLHPTVIRRPFDDDTAPPITSANQWLRTCRLAGVEQLPLERSVDDTVTATTTEMRWHL